jgi:hypothetical protein
LVSPTSRFFNPLLDQLALQGRTTPAPEIVVSEYELSSVREKSMAAVDP